MVCKPTYETPPSCYYTPQCTRLLYYTRRSLIVALDSVRLQVLCIRADQTVPARLSPSATWRHEPGTHQPGLALQRLKSYYPQTWRFSLWQVLTHLKWSCPMICSEAAMTYSYTLGLGDDSFSFPFGDHVANAVV